ncbi:MAG: Hsp70 family protein [Lachnospiraceae bacterium]|nr:Hsp70 family protein [Lachnospiraceae bacterium]
MERFLGFDLGDAESAVSYLKKDGMKTPEVIPVRDAKSFITAYARMQDGTLLIGEEACYAPDAAERKIRFKSRFLKDSDVDRDIKSFAAGVLGELYTNGDLVQGEDCCFYVGCPAGWDKNDRERYRMIFEKTGYPPAKIVSESRAALVSACRSKHLQVGYDILAHPVLVVDIGSSTTDFAYIAGGREVELLTGGEVFLGGGVMDEILLEESVAASPAQRKIREAFTQSDAWRSYCEFASRRLKEKYFSDEEYWKTHACTQTVQIVYDRPVRLVLRMDEKIADKLLNKRVKSLDGKSFREVFLESLRDTRKNIKGDLPDLIFLTGGVSRLPAVSEWCREIYPEAVIITELAPEFSVSKGLAWCGSIDEEMREFEEELQNLIDSTVVEKIVTEQIDGLYMAAVDALTGPILENCVVPIMDRWRSGKIEKLADIDGELKKEIDAYLHTDAAKNLLVDPVAQWLRKYVASELEQYTMPICLRHKIPYRALSLSSYLSLSEIDIKLNAKTVFGVEPFTWMIDTIISILVGLLCGGSGIALIANGLPGIFAGAVISLVILFLGKNKMQSALMKVNIPLPVRKLLPKKYFENHLESITDEVRASFYESLEKDKNEEISERLAGDISRQIEECLTKMARVVEIPLVS